MLCSNRVLLRRLRLASPLILVGTGATITFCTLPALAYRPFDGTDAAVADANEIEIELQALGWRRDDPQKALITPGVRFNYGFAERWEFVAEGNSRRRCRRLVRRASRPPAAFLKYMVKPGVLQDQTGLSIAIEFGPLLPELNGDRGTGFSWAAMCLSGGTVEPLISTSKPI
jgi:hypothetical protein